MPINLEHPVPALPPERGGIVGGTLFVRDAKIELQQGALQASNSNIGVVPLANFLAEYYPAKRWSIVSELDGLAAPQGRAFDFSLKANYDLADWCSLGFGYRAIEGGVDNDTVYNFAWLQSVVASVAALTWRFGAGPRPNRSSVAPAAAPTSERRSSSGRRASSSRAYGTRP